MPIALLDLIVLGVLFVSAALAMMRGFTREVLATASWLAAAVAAYLLYKQVIPYVEPYVANKNFQTGISVAVVFFVALILVSLITVRISDFILDSKIGALDRTLGLVFGAARGILICIVGFAFFDWLAAGKRPDWIMQAKARPYLQAGADKLKDYLPDDPEKLIQQFKSRKGDGNTEPPAETDQRTNKPAQ
jgi:membrane protein required for colicin V production